MASIYLGSIIQADENNKVLLLVTGGVCVCVFHTMCVCVGVFCTGGIDHGQTKVPRQSKTTTVPGNFP